MDEKVTLCGVRPVALRAVSERERLKACPHRAQAAVNHARALKAARAAMISAAEPEKDTVRAEIDAPVMVPAMATPAPGPEKDTAQAEIDVPGVATPASGPERDSFRADHTVD